MVLFFNSSSSYLPCAFGNVWHLSSILINIYIYIYIPFRSDRQFNDIDNFGNTRKLAEYEALVSELLSSRFVHLAVTIPLSTEMVDGNSSSFDTFEDMDWEEQESEENSKTFGERYRSCEGGRETRDVGNGHGGGVEVRVIKNGAGEKLREELLTAVQGLLRLGEMEKVLGVVQERVSEDLKLIIRCDICLR